MDKKPLNEMGHDEIKEAVKEKYSHVAKDPCATFNFPVGKGFALKVGYPKEVLDSLPQSMTESFTGANNPQSFAELKEGETVLDLGCGAGLDLYFYAKAVGERGKVCVNDCYASGAGSLGSSGHTGCRAVSRSCSEK